MVQPMAYEGTDGQKGVACTFVTDRGFLFFYQKQLGWAIGRFATFLFFIGGGGGFIWGPYMQS